LPSEAEFAGRLIKPRAPGKLPILQASEEDLKKYPATPAARSVNPPAPTAPRTYPPLEPVSR
jgi:outer membrane protein assembly factor BamE